MSAIVSLLVFLQVSAVTPRLEESDYVLLREGEPAPFAGVLVLDSEYRELRLKESELVLKESELETALERFEESEQSYHDMKTVADGCVAELDKIVDESPAWYESVEFWLGAVVGAGLTIATVFAVDELR